MCNFGITVNRSQTSPDVQKLAPPSDPDYLSPIEYAYDPLRSISPLASQPSRSSFSGATQTNHFLALNSVQLDPNAAGLPYRSSLNHVYVSKHWESNRAEALTLLEFLAKDGSKSDIVVDHGITLANLARKILRPGLEHQMALATQYMFPGADERRIRLISAVMILYFVFDGEFLRVLLHVPSAKYLLKHYTQTKSKKLLTKLYVKATERYELRSIVKADGSYSSPSSGTIFYVDWKDILAAIPRKAASKITLTKSSTVLDPKMRTAGTEGKRCCKRYARHSATCIPT